MNAKTHAQQAAEIARIVADLLFIDGLPAPVADQLATAIEMLSRIAAELADGGVSHG